MRSWEGHALLTCDIIQCSSRDYWLLREVLSTLPTGFLGKASTKRTSRTHLNDASLSLHNRTTSSEASSIPGRLTTKATGISPHLLWGRPTTAASATEGCVVMTASSSAG